MAHFLWKWEERLKDTPATVEREEWQTRISPTTGIQINELVKVTLPNLKTEMIGQHFHLEFSQVPVSYVYEIETPAVTTDETSENPQFALSNDVFQTEHLVTGMYLEGVEMPDPSVSPPAPVIYDLDELLQTDALRFDIEYQLQHMRDVDRYVVNPLEMAHESGVFRNRVSVEGVIKKSLITITNEELIPAWSKDYVGAVVNNQVMRLDSGGRFAVGVSTTRAEFAGAVVRALGLTEADAVRQGFPFTDVSSLDADRASMELAYRCGIIYGRSEVTFAPDATVTRQDAAAMLLRAFGLRNESLVPSADAANLQGFKDQDAISDYAAEGMAQAVALGFFNGYTDGTLKPQNQILNEQTATILWEMKLKAVK